MSVKQETTLAPETNIEASSGQFQRNMLNTAKGGSIIASGQLIAYGSRFIMAFLLARALGADQYGLYNLALSVGTIIAGVAVFGLHTALVRYVAVLTRKKDKAALWGALQFGLGTSTMISVLLSTGLFAFSYVIAEGIYHRADLAPLLQLMALIVPFMTLSTVLTGATQGFKKMHYTVIANDIALVAVRLILTVILFVIGMNAFQAVVIFGIANVTATAILFYFLHKEFSLKRNLRSATVDWREMLGYSLPVWISGLLRTFRSNIQTLLLGSFYTAAGVGIFNVAAQVNLIGRMTFNSINTSAKPLIAELYSQDDRQQMASVYQTTGRWAYTVNLPIFLTLLLFAEGILAIFGKDFVDGALALRILALSELIDVMTGICGSIIDMTGHTKLKLANSILQLVLAISLNVLLIPKWGLMGAAIGALIVNAVINLLRMGQVWYVFRMLPFNRSFFKPSLAASVALVVALVMRQLISNAQDLVWLIIQTTIIFAVYAGILFLLGLPEEERTIITRMWHRITQMRFKRKQA